MNELEIRMIPIEELLPYAKNARLHPEAHVKQIAASIKEFGFRDPVEVSSDNIIIAGHGRVLALQMLGAKQVPCIIHGDLDKSAWRAYNLVNNKLTDNSEWDLELLKGELEELKTDFDFEELGFDLSEYLPEAEVHPPGEGEEDAIPENVETRCKPGDLWILGDHRLLCGDSTNIQHVERLMNGEKADMVFTDPPYGLDCSGGTWASNPIYSKAKEWDKILDQDVIDYILLLSDKVVLWGGNYYSVPPSRCWLSWRKSNPLKTGSDFELAWTNFDKCCKEFVAACNSEGKRQHPTQKPVSLSEWCFENYGDPKSVLDLFLGSGSTLIACEKTGRKCYGMEIDPHYCSVILERWEKYSGKTAVLEESDASR